jgi:hypothetical protein
MLILGPVRRANFHLRIWSASAADTTLIRNFFMLYGILVAIRSEEDTACVTQRAAMLVAELKGRYTGYFAVAAPSCARRAVSWMRGPKQHSERAEQEHKTRRLSCQSEYLRQHYGVRCTIVSGVDDPSSGAA